MKITFGYRFNRDVSGLTNLREVVLGQEFKNMQSLVHLPKLENLTMSPTFNSDIKMLLDLKNLRVLTFNNSFDSIFHI